MFVYGRVFKDYPPQDHWYLTLSSVRCAQRDLFSAGTAIEFLQLEMYIYIVILPDIHIVAVALLKILFLNTSARNAECS